MKVSHCLSFFFIISNFPLPPIFASSLASLESDGIDAKKTDLNDWNNNEDSSNTSNNLRGVLNVASAYGSCKYQGHFRNPGQWLRGETKTCMCDRHKTGKWTKCVDNYSGQYGSNGSDNNARNKRAKFNDKDFVFDLLGSAPEAITDAGSIQSLTIDDLPSLAGEGISFTLFTIEPCGINLPHSHPRATELLYLIQGEDLQTAFVEENGGRVIVNTLKTGYTTFFPKGLIHYQQNKSCKRAVYISALNNEDPGVITTTTRFFQLPEAGVQGALGQDESLVNKLIEGLPGGPAEGREECMAKCGW